MRIHTVITTLIAATLIVVGADYAAYAATGQSLLLGKSNSADALTSVSRTTNGPAVAFNTLAGQPPFSVARSTRVARLNADLIDGLDSTALKTQGRHYSVAPTTLGNSFLISFPGLPLGIYQASYSVFADESQVGTKVHCYLYRNNSPMMLLAFGSTYADMSTATASGIVDLRAGAAQLYCFTEGGSMDSLLDAQASFVKVDTVTNGTGSTANAARTTQPQLR